MVNHYIKTGEETELSREDFRICPKCGRHYPKGIDVCLFCVEKSYIIKRAFNLAKPYLGGLAISGILLSISTALGAMIPVFNAKLIDGYLSNSALTVNEKIRGVVILVLLMAFTQIAGRFFAVVSQRRTNRISSKFSNDMRLLVYDKVQRLSLSSMSKKTSGDLMKRVTRDTEVVRRFVTEHGMYAIEKLIMFTVILIVLISISPLTDVA